MDSTEEAEGHKLQKWFSKCSNHDVKNVLKPFTETTRFAFLKMALTESVKLKQLKVGW